MGISFRGKIIKHKIYGRGKVDGDYLLSGNDRRLRVLYDSGFIANYIYPEDFINKKLETEDKEIINEIKSFHITEERRKNVSESDKTGKDNRILKLRHDNLDLIINQPHSIPEVLHNSILSMFGVWHINDLPVSEIEYIKKNCKSLFKQTGETDYSRYCQEYTLYYLPLNMYKCWQPLHALLSEKGLPASLSILELGAGPGTSSFGVIEFYRQLADENHEIQFNLKFMSVEIESAFQVIFKKLYEPYIATLPSNLSVDFKCVNEDAFKYVFENSTEYSLILESNMLNVNEKIHGQDLLRFAEKLKKTMSVGGFVVFIEPDKSELVETFQVLSNLLDRGNCMQIGPIVSQAVNISNDILISELKDAGIYEGKQDNLHHFCYAVFNRRY